MNNWHGFNIQAGGLSDCGMTISDADAQSFAARLLMNLCVLPESLHLLDLMLVRIALSRDVLND